MSEDDDERKRNPESDEREDAEREESDHGRRMRDRSLRRTDQLPCDQRTDAFRRVR